MRNHYVNTHPHTVARRLLLDRPRHGRAAYLSDRPNHQAAADGRVTPGLLGAGGPKARWPPDSRHVACVLRTAARSAGYYASRRLARHGERKACLLNRPALAWLKDLVRVARSRWPIGQQYWELKDKLGHFEGRSYRGGNHH